jgi:large subunit ribosomal protein L32
MPNPKRKHSKQRRDKRRTHYKMGLPTLAKCSNCGATIRYHYVCPECGYYRGKKAIEKEVSV